MDCATAPDPIERLAAIVGGDHVLLGDERSFYAHDVFRPGVLPQAVVRPGSVEELQAVVATATSAGLAIVPRGGGASYTDGYLAVSPHSVTIDTSRLTRIVEINQTDMFVTVEAGVTWAALNGALAELGLRTPFFGPFSGLVATVGGAVSQHSVSHGTGAHGLSAESVVAMEVVLASGRLIRTGQAGSVTGHPFFRYYGPDLTGLFTGDCGAFGIKARITLRLIRRPAAALGLSFAFDTFEAMHAAMARIAAEGLDDENFGLDAALSQGQIARNSSAGRKLEIARGILATSGPLSAGLKLARLAVARTESLRQPGYFAHYIVTGLDHHDATRRCRQLGRLGADYGLPVSNAVPTIVSSLPFAPLTNILGPRGERWVPMHGLLPHSRAVEFHRAASALFERYRAAMGRLRVHHGAMFMAMGAGSFLYEPAFYWEDSRSVFHDTILDAAHRATLPAYPPNPDGQALIVELRGAIMEIFHRLGAAHLQVGKVYPLLRDRDAGAVALLRAVKAALDPGGLMNPGALGL